jgi:hypothetical protein
MSVPSPVAAGRVVRKTFNTEKELGDFLQNEAPRIFNYFSFSMTKAELGWDYNLEYIPGALQ